MDACQTCVYLEEMDPAQAGGFRNRCALLDVWDVPQDGECPYHYSVAEIEEEYGERQNAGH